MFKKLTACAIAVLLIFPLGLTQPVVASPGPNKETRLVQRVKAGVARLGVGPEALVKVKLKDKTKLAGYLSEVGEDYFSVTDLETGRTTVVAYPDVAQMQGNNLSTNVKIVIAASIITGAIIVLYYVKKTFESR